VVTPKSTPRFGSVSPIFMETAARKTPPGLRLQAEAAAPLLLSVSAHLCEDATVC